MEVLLNARRGLLLKGGSSYWRLCVTRYKRRECEGEGEGENSRWPTWSHIVGRFSFAASSTRAAKLWLCSRCVKLKGEKFIVFHFSLWPHERSMTTKNPPKKGKLSPRRIVKTSRKGFLLPTTTVESSLPPPLTRHFLPCL